MHTEAHPDAGQTVNVLISTHPTLPPGVHQFVIEGWWDHLTQSSWMYAQGNPAALIYAVHSGMAQLPIDDEVLYGHIGGAGVLLHVSEINQEVGA